MQTVQWEHPFSKTAEAWIKKHQAYNQLLIYPTETFFALGCRADCEEGIQRVYALKQRLFNKPLPLVIHNWAVFERYFSYPSLAAQQFLQAIWPGPLTVVLPSQGLAGSLNKNSQYLAVRMSADPLVQDLLSMIQAPLVSTSANLSGQPPQTEFFTIEKELRSAVDCCILKSTLNPTLLNPTLDLKSELRPQDVKPTTILKIFAKQPWQILRAGQLSQAQLQKHTQHRIIPCKGV